MDFKVDFTLHPGTSELALRQSPEASEVARTNSAKPIYKVEQPKKVKKEAQGRVLRGGGDPETAGWCSANMSSSLASIGVRPSTGSSATTWASR